MLWGNANDGVMCPVSMTYAAIPALRDGAPELAAEWEPRLTLDDYERGALAGMAMTERQGGSDVRANITRAEPVGDGSYELHGHKWFCSYPPCDVFLVLAQAVPARAVVLPGRARRRAWSSSASRTSSARARCPPPRWSSAAPWAGWSARRAGACRRSSAWSTTRGWTACSARRRGCAAARWRPSTTRATARRSAPALADQPAMRNVLADLAIESEAATVTAMRVARAYDEPSEGAFRRFATAVCKYWVSKRAAAHAAEALECLGGNGFVEDSGMPLLYRDAPLNSIWEGSGNVAALDVLRAIVKEPEGLPAFLAECELAAGAEPRLDAHLAEVRERVTETFAAARAPVPRSGSTPASSAPGASSRTSPWRSRPRCSSATRRRRWPTRSAPGGSRATAGACTARCPPGSTPAAIIERAVPV